MVGPNCMGVLSTDPAVALTPRSRRRGPPRATSACSRRAVPSGSRSSTTCARSTSGCRASSRSATRPTSRATTSCRTGPRTRARVSSFSTSRASGTRASSPASRPPWDVTNRSSRSSRVARRPERARPRATRRPWRASTLRSMPSSSRRHPHRHAGELFDVAALLATQPVPTGPRVGIVTNGGGRILSPTPVRQTARASATRRRDDRGAARLPAGGGRRREPVDMIASATPEQFARTIEVVGTTPSTPWS